MNEETLMEKISNKNPNGHNSLDRDIILLHMIEILDYAAYITGVDGIQAIEMKPEEMGYRLYITGFKIESAQPMIHVKHIKHIEVPDSFTNKKEKVLLTPDMDIWVNGTTLDGEMLIQGMDKLYTQLREAKKLELLELTYNKTVAGQYKTVTDATVYADKRQACKDAIAFRKKTPCKFKFISVGRDVQLQQLRLEHKMTDLEFAESALEET